MESYEVCRLSIESDINMIDRKKDHVHTAQYSADGPHGFLILWTTVSSNTLSVPHVVISIGSYFEVVRDEAQGDQRQPQNLFWSLAICRTY